MANEQETVKLTPHEWNVVMDVLRVDVESPDASSRLGDVARQTAEILEQLQKQLGRDGVERH